MFGKNNILCIDVLVHGADCHFSGASKLLANTCDRYFTILDLLNSVLICQKYCVNNHTLMVLSLEHIPKKIRQNYQSLIIEKSPDIKIMKTTDSVSSIINRSQKISVKHMSAEELDDYRFKTNRINFAKKHSRNLPIYIKKGIYLMPITNKNTREHNWISVPKISQPIQADEKSSIVYFEGNDVIVHLPIKHHLLIQRYELARRLMNDFFDYPFN